MRQVSDGNINLARPRLFWVTIALAAAIVTSAATIVVATFVVSPSPAQAQVECNALPATLTGTNDSETLNGTAAADVIALLGGDDESNGAAGNDCAQWHASSPYSAPACPAG